MNQDVALSLLLLFSAVCYLLLGARLMVSRREIGSMPIGVLFLVVSIWVLGGAIELLSGTYALFSLGRTGHFVGTALVPVIAYVCFREYTGSKTRARTILLLSAIPVASIALAATNSLHELMWFSPFTNAAGEFLARPERWGAWFLFVHLPYSYAVFGAAILTLLAHSTAVAPAHRRGLFMLIAACLGPLIATAMYDVGIGPNTISYVPLVFAAMLPVYVWLIVVEQIVEFTPLAYETVFQHMQDPVVVLDEHSRVIGLNHTAEAMLDVSEADALREPLETLFGAETPEVFAALNTGTPQKMLTSTGRFLHVQASPIARKGTQARGGQVLMFRDVSDVEHAQSEVRNSEKLLRTLIDHSVNGITRFRWLLTETGSRTMVSIFANTAAARFLGKTTEELVDCTAVEFARVATNGMSNGEIAAVLAQVEAAVDEGQALDIDVCHSSQGQLRWLRMIFEPVGDDMAATLIDISDSKAKEHKMESIAASDPLTGLLNRRGFEQEASDRLVQSDDAETGALLFIDLNRFKNINDEHGHHTGDQLLIIAAERLRNGLRSCDILGRPGGDEFVALVPNVDADTAHGLASRLTRDLEVPYRIGGEKLLCAASIGLALYPENANTLTGLLRDADRAMYRAKARCRGVTDIRGDDLLEKAG